MKCNPRTHNRSLATLQSIAKRSICVRTLLLCALASVRGLAQNDDGAIREKIDALLGTRDTFVAPEAWRALDPGAGPVLESIASDHNALPTRRARSVEGLAVFANAHSSDLLIRLAQAENEPDVVRMSAVRALGRTLNPSRLLTELRPVLRRSPNARLRGVAAEVLSAYPGACPEIRDQAKAETSEWRAHFLKTNCEAEGASSQELGMAGTNELESRGREALTFHTVTSGAPEAAATNASSGQPQIIDLGTVPVYTNVLSPISFTLPVGTASIELTGFSSDDGARVVIYRIDTPDGRLYDYASLNNVVKLLPPTNSGGFSYLLPNSPTVPFSPGAWTINLVASRNTTASVHAILKTAPVPAAASIDFNLFFVGLPTLNASSAQTDQNFQALIQKVRAIYGQVGVSIGNLTYTDITGAAATIYSDVTEDKLGALNELSAHTGARPNAVNIFLVHTIGFAALSGFIILGEAGGVPGDLMPGTSESGVAVTTADFPNGLDEIANTLAHETGHWLGLFHTTEANGSAFDPLPDTPQCPRVPYDTNGDGIMEPQECINFGATNLMFWTSVATIPHSLLTPNQGFVMLHNPAAYATAVTLPAIVPQISGTLGNNGWYTSDVTASWITETDTGFTFSGCNSTTLTESSAGVILTCAAMAGAAISNYVQVAVKIDKTPPIISGMPAQGCTIWPPNRKLVHVATVTAFDALSGLGDLAVDVTSNEPADSNNPAVVITGNPFIGFDVQLRADRLGTGAGRIYTITAKAADRVGNTAAAVATCTVPHDLGN